MPAQVIRMPMRADDAAAIAAAAAAAWRAIDGTLSPIIGRRGVGALFKRSLHLTRPTHPCLAIDDAALMPDEFAALRAVLAAQPADTAAAADEALRKTLHDLLGHLIGGALTDRLLGPFQESRRDPAP